MQGDRMNRRPVDRVAARVVGRGVEPPENWKRPKRPKRAPYGDVPRARFAPIPDGVRDLSGMTFGKLRVLGFSVRGNAQKPVWLCQCVCHTVVCRKAKSLLRNSASRCSRCT